MKAEEALGAATVKKEEGNAKFKAKDLAEADICYKDALKFLESSKPENKEAAVIKIACFQNRALCAGQQKDQQAAVNMLTKAMNVHRICDIEDGRVKSLCLRGSAYMKLKDYIKSEEDFKAALVLAPGD